MKCIERFLESSLLAAEVSIIPKDCSQCYDTVMLGIFWKVLLVSYSSSPGGGGYSLIWAILKVCAARKGRVFQPLWS